jgi:hypothetical protein
MKMCIYILTLSTNKFGRFSLHRLKLTPTTMGEAEETISMSVNSGMSYPTETGASTFSLATESDLILSKEGDIHSLSGVKVNDKGFRFIPSDKSGGFPDPLTHPIKEKRGEIKFL